MHSQVNKVAYTNPHCQKERLAHLLKQPHQPKFAHMLWRSSWLGSTEPGHMGDTKI